jgi:hypothetical protein
MKKLFYIGFVAFATIACSGESTTTIEDKSTEVKINEPKVEVKKSSKDLIVGSWQVISIKGEDQSAKKNPIILTFNADGSATSTAKTGKKVTWEIKDTEGKQTLILSPEGTAKEEVKITSIDEKKLAIVDKDNDIILIRK